MKIPLIVALAGFAISFVLPTFAEQTEATPSGEDRQESAALTEQSDDAWNNNDAPSLAGRERREGMTCSIFSSGEFIMWFVDTSRFPDCVRGARVIAAQHDNLAYTALVEAVGQRLCPNRLDPQS